MKYTALILLIITTCIACSDEDVQISLEKVDSQEESTFYTDPKSSIYKEQTDTNKTQQDEAGLPPKELSVQEAVEVKEKDTVAREKAIEEVKNKTSNDEALISNLMDITTLVPGSTSIKESSDSFGFTVDLSADYLFKFDQEDLNAKGQEALESILMLYKQYNGIGIDVAGHTDSKGSSNYNAALSRRRASAVKRWFESKGIHSSVITATGFGESQPIAPNFKNNKDYPDGRSLNRRVSLAVTTENRIQLPLKKN